ncbi:MAG TPA: sugar ABC transporter substrate-binding protein [Candidatus Eisenbergiella intestinipullorum]|nr:sugar ABC transporter substrate-binding protein [Candidatus Eisenbergiella intestinipullorum]
MKRNRVIGFCLAGAMGVSLLGCSGNETAGGTAASAGTEASAETAGEVKPSEEADSSSGTGEVTEIRFTEWDGGETLALYEEIAEKFNAEHPDIHVTVMNIPSSEYDTKITAMIAGNDTPEICYMESGTILYPLAEEGVILNLQEYIDNDPEFDKDCLMEELTYRMSDDFVVAYGAGAENMCMFYNPSLFEEYGVEEPPASYEDAWDWDTFVKNAQLLTIDSEGRNALDPAFDPENIEIYGVNLSQWWGGYMPFMYSVGCDYLNEDGTSIGYATEEGIEVFQRLQDLIYKYHVAPTPTVSSSMPGLSEILATNKVAMSFSGQWDNATLMEDEVVYNVAAFPKMGEEAKTIITCAGISLMNTEKADAAWEFMKYLFTEVGANEPLYKSALWLPNNKKEYNDEYMKSCITDKHPSNYYETCVKPMLDGTAEPPVTARVKNFSKINDIITPALDQLWSGEKTAREVLEGVKEAADAQVQGYYAE